MALDSNWPVAAALVILTSFVGMLILPALLSSSSVLAQLTERFKPVVWSLCGVFALAAIIKCRFAMRTESRLRMHEYLTREAAIRSVARFPRHAHFKAELAQTTLLHAATPKRPIKPASSTLSPTTPTDKPAAWSLDLVQAIDWKRFEELCAKFYREQKIACVMTPLGSDGGIEIRLLQNDYGAVNIDRQPTAIVQCKAWGARLIGVKAVRELLAIMTREKIPKAFLMTSGSFTDGARIVAKSNNITLVDGNLFLTMIARMPGESIQRLLLFAIEGDYATPSCPRCAVKMIAREGERGLFWGCVAYPKCRQNLPMRGVGAGEAHPAGDQTRRCLNKASFYPMHVDLTTSLAP